MNKKTEIVVKPVLESENLVVSFVSNVPLPDKVDGSKCPVNINEFNPDIREKLISNGAVNPKCYNSSAVLHPDGSAAITKELIDPAPHSAVEEHEAKIAILNEKLRGEVDVLTTELASGSTLLKDENAEELIEDEFKIAQPILPTNETNPYIISRLFKFTAEPNLKELLRYNIVFDMIQQLPEFISKRIMLYPSYGHVITGLKVESLFNSSVAKQRILNTISPDVKFAFIFYLGYNPNNSTYTTNISYTGIRTMYAEIIKDIEDLYAGEYLTEALEFENAYFDQMLDNLLDSHGDLSLYDNNISIAEAYTAYDRLGKQYKKHCIGRKVFTEFLNSKWEYFPGGNAKINIDGNIYAGYYNNRILLVPDCIKNHVRIYLFDPASFFTYDYMSDDWMDDVLECVDVEYGGDILTQLSHVICHTYQKLFNKYNSVEENASEDV